MASAAAFYVLVHARAEAPATEFIATEKMPYGFEHVVRFLQRWERLQAAQKLLPDDPRPFLPRPPGCAAVFRGELSARLYAEFMQGCRMRPYLEAMAVHPRDLLAAAPSQQASVREKRMFEQRCVTACIWRYADITALWPSLDESEVPPAPTADAPYLCVPVLCPTPGAFVEAAVVTVEVTAAGVDAMRQADCAMAALPHAEAALGFVDAPRKRKPAADPDSSDSD